MYKKGVFTVFALICLSAGTVSYARNESLNGQTVADEPLPEYFGKTDNLSSIIRPLVYHKDGTFAAYMNVDDRCVLPGGRAVLETDIRTFVNKRR